MSLKPIKLGPFSLESAQVAVVERTDAFTVSKYGLEGSSGVSRHSSKLIHSDQSLASSPEGRLQPRELLVVHSYSSFAALCLTRAFSFSIVRGFLNTLRSARDSLPFVDAARREMRGW